MNGVATCSFSSGRAGADVACAAAPMIFAPEAAALHPPNGLPATAALPHSTALPAFTVKAEPHQDAQAPVVEPPAPDKPEPVAVQQAHLAVLGDGPAAQAGAAPPEHCIKAGVGDNCNGKRSLADLAHSALPDGATSDGSCAELVVGGATKRQRSAQEDNTAPTAEQVSRLPTYTCPSWKACARLFFQAPGTMALALRLCRCGYCACRQPAAPTPLGRFPLRQALQPMACSLLQQQEHSSRTRRWVHRCRWCFRPSD